MNAFLTSMVWALVVAEPVPNDGIPPQTDTEVRDLDLNPPNLDPAPQGEAELRLATYYAVRIQAMPWEWDDAKTRLSTYVQLANDQGFEVRIASPPQRRGMATVVIDAQNGDRAFRATGHWNTPFLIRDDTLIYLDCTDHGNHTTLVKMNLLNGEILWKRPFHVMHGMGGSIRHRKYALELTPDAIILTGQDYQHRFRAIRSLETGAQLAFRDYP
jgi:hypothetical protein